jgi:inosine-uridine nucleoside N-ribohydrolase
MDVAAARAVFHSGVPIRVMPLDATQQRLNASRRRELFAAGTGLAADLEALYREWAAAAHRHTPVLYDLVAVAHAIDPALCPAAPMRIEVDDDGFTRVRPGPPNSLVCLGSDATRLLDFYMPRLTRGVPARGCRARP